MNETAVLESFLLPMIILIPMVGAFVLYAAGVYSRNLRNILSVVFSALPLLILIRFYFIIQDTSVIYRIEGLLDYGLTFSLDMLSFIFALMVAIVWFLTSLYLIDYFTNEKHQERFYFFLFLTLSGSLGTVLTADLFTLFVFFELMSMASYVLIVHKEDLISIKAANKYLLMAVFGALALLMGIIFVYHYTGTVALVPMVDYLPETGIKYLIAALFIVGFGIKAGMFPVHIWLPDAHPVAPTPASALLSGVMIKLGVYGLIRVFNIMFIPEGLTSVGSSFASNMGYVIILLGFVTMFLGAFLALFQVNMKKILAYSSISQVGYIITAVGIAGYMGLEDTSGLGSALYHVINHALFKSLLFLVVGIIYYRIHELNINKISGLARKMPFVTAVFLIGMAGIIGFPGFNGYVSKVLLHEAVVESYQYQGSKLLYYGEKLFKLTGILTAAYFMKILIPVYLGKMSDNVKNIKNKGSNMMKLSIGVLGLFIMFIGLFPGQVFQYILQPALQERVTAEFVAHLDHIFEMVHIQSAVFTIFYGFIVYMFLRVTRLFAVHLNRNLSLEYLIYRPLISIFFYFSDIFISIFDKKLTHSYDSTFHIGSYFSKLFLLVFDYENGLQQQHESQDSKIDQISSGLRDTAISSVEKLQEGYNHHFSDIHWDIKNLDFDLYILVLVLLMVLVFMCPGLYYFI